MSLRVQEIECTSHLPIALCQIVGQFDSLTCLEEAGRRNEILNSSTIAEFFVPVLCQSGPKRTVFMYCPSVLLWQPFSEQVYVQELSWCMHKYGIAFPVQCCPNLIIRSDQLPYMTVGNQRGIAIREASHFSFARLRVSSRIPLHHIPMATRASPPPPVLFLPYTVEYDIDPALPRRDLVAACFRVIGHELGTDQIQFVDRISELQFCPVSSERPLALVIDEQNNVPYLYLWATETVSKFYGSSLDVAENLKEFRRYAVDMGLKVMMIDGRSVGRRLVECGMRALYSTDAVEYVN